ncbi:uncharacterized protein LOC125770655 [Anopheles funestus]|uniref:uncharacterized protein LOC125770655 n=1 Tax=Anopheles funestus TaxID=62324 RepID=UPI0020C62202|nr:uncharacterized protein LOC125770655 [Anopheles funestus]
MFQCPAFEDVRRELLYWITANQIDSSNLPSKLLESKENWCRVQEAAKLVMSALQQIWRDEEVANNNTANQASPEAQEAAEQTIELSSNWRRMCVRRKLLVTMRYCGRQSRPRGWEQRHPPFPDAAGGDHHPLRHCV